LQKKKEKAVRTALCTVFPKFTVALTRFPRKPPTAAVTFANGLFLRVAANWFSALEKFEDEERY
jgi:hypothetical protein